MIPHGTYSGYKHHRCRCAPCNQACRDYVNHRSRMVAYGRWEPWGDLDQVRAHLRWLQKRGVSLVRVAELAGVGVSTVSYVANRAVRVRRGVAEKILSVTCDPVPAGTRVSAVGTIRRVRALAALGWTSADIAARAGLSRAAVRRLMSGTRKTVMSGTASVVVGVYRELGGGWAPACRESGLVAAHAEARGWAPPAGWDEEWLDLSDEELGAELDRLVGLMGVAELQRCYRAMRSGDRSPLVVAAGRAYRRQERQLERERRLGVAA